MIYKFRENYRINVPAQTIGEEVERIERERGSCPPDVLVDESREESAPLHPAFEWDDEVAAELHRVEQARRIIRSVTPVFTKPESESDTEDEDEQETNQTPAFVSIKHYGEGNESYVSTAKAIAVPELRDAILRDALRGLLSWKSRYGHLKQLASVVAVIDDVNEFAC